MAVVIPRCCGAVTQPASVEVATLSLWLDQWPAALLAVALGGLLYRSRSRRLAAERQLQKDIARRLREAQETERRRIASELHDSVGQSLLIIKNRADLAREAGHDFEAVQAQIEAVARCATQAIEDVRQLAQSLGTYQLQRVGLTAAIDNMLDRVGASSHLVIRKQLERVDELFSPDSAVSIYRLAQEALNNVVRHAGASKVIVSLVRDISEVRLVIEDNGRGFPVKPKRGKSVVGGFGLDDMMERAWLLGGTLRIDSEADRGTRLSLTLPLRELAL